MRHAIICTCVLSLLAGVSASARADHGREGGQPAESCLSLGLRGVYFVPNKGQWLDETVIYGFRSRGLDAAFRESGLSMHLRRAVARASRPCEQQDVRAERDASIHGCALGIDSAAAWESLVLEVTFPGSHAVIPRGAKPQAAKFNYYIGDDESKWRSDVPSFGAIIYENLYDGIDLHVMESPAGGVLKYEFHCAPGSDHSQIRVHYDGIDALRIDERGDLLIATSFGTLRDTAPVVWQPPGGTGILPVPNPTNIPARFEALEDRTYTIELLDNRDPRLPLIIDPEIEWMVYLGGSDSDEGIDTVADGVDGLLVTGATLSTDFEGRNNANFGDWDVFVARMSASGVIQWMTYAGGSGEDRGFGIDRDPGNAALVTGWTRSSDFGGRNNSLHGNSDAFLARITSTGTIGWMTYIGGRAGDIGNGVGADSDGGAWLSGQTTSVDFEGRNNSYRGGPNDAFVAKVRPSGTIDWMTYLGGGGAEQAFDVKPGSNNQAVATGYTLSADFAGRNNSHHGGTSDGFVAAVRSTGTIDWMTYLGGSGFDFCWDIAVGSSGQALVTGRTTSNDFQRRGNYHFGHDDAFVASVEPGGTIDWMMYLGGTAADFGLGIAVDAEDAAIITGTTESTDFVASDNSHHGGTTDAFVAKLDRDGLIEWMSYLGGGGDDRALDIALDGAGHALVIGVTGSSDFRGRINSYRGGPSDAFIVKVPVTRSDHPARLVDINVLDGVIISGGLEQLVESDDEYLETEARVTGEVHQPHLLRLRIGAVTEVDSPSAFDLTIEGRITDVEAQTTLLLRDSNTNQFVQVDQYDMTFSEDTHTATIDEAARFVRDSDGRIELQIKQIVFLPFTLNGFHTLFDQVEIAVR